MSGCPRIIINNVPAILENVNFSTLTGSQCQDIFTCIINEGTEEQFNQFLEKLNLSDVSVDFTELITNLTPDEQITFCQSITDANCNLTDLVDFQELSTEQITELSLIHI